MSIFLAIDFGERRTGVAAGETETGMVSPIATIRRSSDQQLIEALELLAREHGASQLLLGLPCLLDGSDGDAASRVRSFAKKIACQCSLPLELVCETLTSRAARERIASYRSSTTARKNSRPKNPSPRFQIDAVAAQIIGEQYLEQHLSP